MAKWLKALGITAGVLVGILVIAAVVVYVGTERRLHRTYAAPEAALTIMRDSATIARGRYLIETRACADCHGKDLGGGIVIDDPMIGRVRALNLTAGTGGVGGGLSVGDWERAIRRGVARDGRPLMVMPSKEYNAMSDADVGAMIAYLETLPPVDKTVPASTLGPLGRVLFFAKKLPLLAAEAVDLQVTSHGAPPPGPTAEYGAYVASGCKGCHGEGFAGGPIPGMPPSAPPAANITPDTTGIGAWSEADFFTAMREGRRPNGTAIKDAMPWRVFGKMNDDEIRALYAYLRTVPPKPRGTR